MDNYLIPANAKRGQYLFGLFRPMDLIIFGIGVVTSLILIAFMPLEETWAAIVAITPGVICSLLVAPVAHYHNVLQLLIEIYQYFTNRRVYMWKGWCAFNESEFESRNK